MLSRTWRTWNHKCVTFKKTKVEDEFIKGSLLTRKIMHLIETKCKMLTTLRKCKSCTRGGGATSCGQILSRCDEKKPSLQGDFWPFKNCRRLAQWEPRFNIQAFIFVTVVRESIYWVQKTFSLGWNYAKI